MDHRNIYKLAFYTSCLSILLIVAAIVVYLIWNYAPGQITVESLFEQLHVNRLAALISLDISTVLIPPFMIFPLLGMYFTLETENKGLATAALGFFATLGSIAWYMLLAKVFYLMMH